MIHLVCIEVLDFGCQVCITEREITAAVYHTMCLFCNPDLFERQHAVCTIVIMTNTSSASTKRESMTT